MAGLPTHPDSHDPAGSPKSPGRPGRAAIAGVALAAVLVAAMVVLHLTGVVGPGSH